MIVVTAADAKYFRGLKNLVGSVHFWAPSIRILVYDLGLTATMRREASDWCDVRLIPGILNDLPVQLRDLYLYAWKPLAIKEALEREESVLWLDAGSDIRAPLDTIDEYIHSDGHFLARGQDVDMTKMSHPQMYRALGADPFDFRKLGHFSGSVQGYLKHSDAYQHVLLPMAAKALLKECIAPAGSSLQNHRYDQSLLSILVYGSGLDVSPKTFLLTAERKLLNEEPLQASEKTIFTARRSSREYIGQLRRRNGEKAYPGLLRKLKRKMGISRAPESE